MEENKETTTAQEEVKGFDVDKLSDKERKKLLKSLIKENEELKENITKLDAEANRVHGEEIKIS